MTDSLNDDVRIAAEAFERSAQIQQLIDVRRYEEASRLLSEQFAAAPDDPVAHSQAATIAYLRDDTEKAKHHIAAALRADPASHQPRWLRFHLLLEEDAYAEAESVILELIHEAPAEPDYIAEYAKVMLFVGDTKKARDLAAEALRLDAEHEEARIVGALISVVEGDDREAHRRITEIFREDPQSLRLGFALYQVLINGRRYREAYGLGRDLLHADPDNDALVDNLIELRINTHWLSLPLYPLMRWSWFAAGGIWVGALFVFAFLDELVPTNVAIVIQLTYVLWVLYSWVYPPLMRRWLRRRGLR